VGPDAWFHILYPSLNSSELAKLQQGLGRPIPFAYENLLRRTNGLTLFARHLSLFGRRTDYSRRVEIRQPFELSTLNVSERPLAAKASWFLFAFYYEDGSVAFIDDEQSRVFRANRSMSQVRLNQWSSLGTFLTSEVIRLSQHFDDRGRQIDPDRPTTP